MFDIKNIHEYREGNRFEAKKAQGGLPDSLWSTYSAFANTNGGVILLGAAENADKSLSVTGIDNADGLIKMFWDTVNNRAKVSVNILRNNSVYTESVDGKTVVVIEVPRAVRQDKPVYINGNPTNGTFRRNGEGDYRCGQAEVKNMIRDAGEITQDRIALDNIPLTALDKETVTRYRMRFANLKPKHVWTPLTDEEFLQRIGAVKRGDIDGTLHPTAAGLLMFGYDTEILNEFPNYFLDYREPFGTDGVRWTDRVTSATGDWSGNLYDFYFRIQDRLTADIKIPFTLRGGKDRIDETRMHEAMREALANALIHSDYYERRGLVIEKSKIGITVSNQGALRIPAAEALHGGVSDPRNGALFLMFSLVGIGERAGSGLANIKAVWEMYKLPAPTLAEQFNPDRTVLTLPLWGEDVGVNVGVNVGVKLSPTEEKILGILKKGENTTINELSRLVGKETRTVERALKGLKDKGLIERIGSDKTGEWKVLTD